jgi:hypothetical protein
MRNTSIIITLMAALLYACNSKQPTHDIEKFTGRWQLHVVQEKVDSAASWEARGGNYKNRQGFILYDGQGGMGVHHVTENYESYEFEGKGGLDSLTHNDFRHLADNFVYFGRYVVNDSSKTIEHHIESANFQNMWGMVAIRHYLFVGDTLILSPITNKYPKSRLKWVKLNDQK